MYISVVRERDIIILDGNIRIIVGKFKGKTLRLILDAPKDVKITKVIPESGKMNYHCYKCSHEFVLEEGEKICPQCGSRDLEPFED